ncbi:MAG: DUF427 domain-containing protein [Silicimonas sp.]|nr:DUF427 domain-containing protein [Silicimonas sp.]
MANQITIRPAEGTWVVRAGGAVLGESSRALALSEGDLGPVIYFPRDDVAMDFLDDSDTVTTCPGKGDARYFSIATNSAILKDSVWSYEAPHEQAAEIAGYLAFDNRDDLAVEQL